MASLNNVPKDLLDSIRDCLDRRVKLSIKRLVNYETKKDKVEQRVLAFSPYRLFIFTAKAPTRVEMNFHYLDIKSIESKKPNQLVISTIKGSHSFTTIDVDTDEVNHMITHIGTSLKTVFPAFPLERLIKKVEVQPSERLRVMHEMMKTIQQKETGPCGGFTAMYACMCDFHNLTYRDEVAWDVDTIYLSQDSRELCLRDFDHLKERDLVPIVSALVHNTWFTTLNANNVKLSPEVCNEVLRVMKKNAVIEAVLMSNTGISSDFVKKLSTTCMMDMQLHKLDLSNNAIDDIGAEYLFGALSSRGKRFTFIDMSRTKVTSRGLNRMAESMSRSPHVFSSLQTLKLANLSSPKVEDLQSLYNFLACPNMLSHLDLSGTDVELEKIGTPLQRGCSQNISCLKLGKTTFTNKRAKEVVVQASFKQFFATVLTLKHLDLSGAKLPADALKELLLGIGCNRNITNMHLDISGVDLQGGLGAVVLQSCLPNINNITSLNISNIAFGDQDLSSVLNSIGQNKTIKHLYMGRIFQGVKPKNMKMIMEGLVNVIQEEDSVIETLSLADSKLKDSMNMIINALGSNTSLTELDISGNMMGDLGARMLSKALQINNKLKTIIWDKNNTSSVGFEDIAEALEKNYTLRKMPIPVYDASVALSKHPDRTEQALQTIERLLQRNHSPQKYSSDQAYRLQQGFLISSTQQMVDRLVVQSQDTINALTYDDGSLYSEDINLAKSIIKDADNSKTLLPALHDIAIKSQDAGNRVSVKLKEIASELRTVLESQMKETVTKMMETAQAQCEGIMRDQDFAGDLKTGCCERSVFPKDFTSNLLTGVDTDIFNTLSEMNLAVAAHVSDRVIDEVIERLSSCHKTLTNHLNQKKKEVTRRSKVNSQKLETNQANLHTKESSSPQTTPESRDAASKESPKMQNKRKSMQTRKIRPQSVIDGLDSEPELSQPPPQVKVQVESELEIDNFDEVPALTEVKPLTTVTKNRARRTRQVRPPTRQSALPGTLPGSEDKDTDDIESFFSPSQLPVVTTSTTTKGGNKDKSSKSSSTPENTKKSGGIFGFRNKDGNKDKDHKKSGGVLSGLLGKKSSKSGSTSSAAANRVSDIQEVKKSKEESPEAAPPAKSALANSLQGSLDRKKEAKTEASPATERSVKDKQAEDTESLKSTESGKSAKSTESGKSAKSTESGKSAKSSDSSSSLDKQSDTSSKGSDKAKIPLELPKKVLSKEQKEETKSLKDDKEGKEKAEDEDKKTEEEEKMTEDTKKEEVVEESAEKTKEPKKVEDDTSSDDDDSEGQDSESSNEKSSEEKKDTTPEDKKEEDEEEKEKETPKPIKKPGLPGGIGFGGNLLAEMKLKQEKRQSMLIQGPAEKAKPADDKPKPAEGNQSPFGLRNLKPVGTKTPATKDLTEAKSKPAAAPLKPVTPKEATEPQAKSSAVPQKPADNILNDERKSGRKKDADSPSVGNSQSGDSDVKRTSLKENGTDSVNNKPAIIPRPQVLNKPTPPTRPKPPPASSKPTPAPRRSLASDDQDETGEDDKPASTEEPKTNQSEIVYDSATLKMSVKDKISKFGRNSGGNGSPSGERPRSKTEDSTESGSKRDSSQKYKTEGVLRDSKKSDSIKACDLDLKTEENPDMTDSGIVQDAEKPAVKAKAGSLPRTAKPSDMEKDKDTPKRPRSMLAVLGNRPDLMQRSTDNIPKSEAIPESEVVTESSKDESSSKQDSSISEDVILV